MICEACGNPIIFYAHQRPVDGRMKFWHPECCEDCPMPPGGDFVKSRK